MSSSHNIVSALKAKAKSNSTTRPTPTSPTAGVIGGFDFVKVGTSSIPVSMLPIVDVNSPPYAKAAAFQSLETTIQNLSETQSVMELMMFVGTKLPIETRFALTEAEAVGQAIRDSVMSIDNLHGLGFFDSKMIRLETEISENLNNRTAGLYYARFASGIHGPSVDKRIRKDRRIHLEFSLKLPQTKYDILDSSTQPLGSPDKSSSSRRLFETPNKEAEEEVDSDNGKELDNMESEQEPPLGQVTPSFPSGMSPKMLAFTNPNNSCHSGVFRIGYYGKLDFFNTQEAFHITFGPSPRMFHATEEGELWNEQEELQDFIDRCKLDIFLSVCKVDYVGDEKASPESYVREVCDEIGKLKQEYMQDGKWIMESPDDLYQNFMQLVANLPDDAKEWPISLPSTYLSALSEKIRSQIIKDKKFKMPKISNLLRKMDQIRGMRSVKNQAVEMFNDMTTRRDEFAELYASMSSGKANKSSTPVHFGRSLAEETIQKYTPQTPDHKDIEIVKKGDKCYPKHIPTGHVSIYPVGFSGCFWCGSSDHWKSQFCPKKSDDRVKVRAFLQELWCHKPQQYKKNEKANVNVGTPHYGPQEPTQDDNSNITIQTTSSRGKSLLPSWMTQGKQVTFNVDESPSKKRKSPFMTFTAKVFSAQQSNLPPMPIKVQNSLPAAVFRFGSSDGDDTTLTFNVDSCAGMNTGNLLVHQWIATCCPDIVLEYKECTDAKGFQHMLLEGVASDTTQDVDIGKLTAIITYKTQYPAPADKISFGLGKSVGVNGIIGLPTLKDWGMILDIAGDRVFSTNLGLQWEMVYIDASRGLPDNVTFDYSDFVRPNSSVALSTTATAEEEVIDMESNPLSS